jgi:hypothetical protein
MPKKAIPDTPEPPVMVRAARLDEAGVFQCVDDLPEAELTPLHLPQIPECDLPPGAYRWDATAATFVALPKKSAEQQMKEPSTLRAIARGFMSLQQAGHVFPDETRDWLAWYAQSVDFKG